MTALVRYNADQRFLVSTTGVFHLVDIDRALCGQVRWPTRPIVHANVPEVQQHLCRTCRALAVWT